MKWQNKMDRIVRVLRIVEETEENLDFYHVGAVFFHPPLKRSLHSTLD